MQEANDRDMLGKPQFKTLNMGVAAVAFAHIMVGYLHRVTSHVLPLYSSLLHVEVHQCLRGHSHHSSWLGLPLQREGYFEPIIGLI